MNPKQAKKLRREARLFVDTYGAPQSLAGFTKAGRRAVRLVLKKMGLVDIRESLPAETPEAPVAPVAPLDWRNTDGAVDEVTP